MPGFGHPRKRRLGFQGVYRIAPGGGDPELIVGRDEYEMPNGICFSPDETLFYVNDTPGAYIKVYDADADGTISNGRMFFEGVGSGVIEEGIPDGMKCDERGNIWVTGPGGIWVISAAGEHLGTILVPENTGNLTWGGEDWHTLYIPSSTSLYTIRTIVGPAARALHGLRRTHERRGTDPGRVALRADHPGPAERRDHRRRRVRRVRLPGAREGAERRGERGGARGHVPEQGHPRDPRPLHRRGGGARPEAECRRSSRA